MNTTDAELESRVSIAKANQTTNKPHRLLRLPEVLDRVRLGRTAVYRNISLGTFPRPIKMVSASFWIESEIDGYIEKLMSQRPASEP